MPWSYSGIFKKMILLKLEIDVQFESFWSNASGNMSFDM